MYDLRDYEDRLKEKDYWIPDRDCRRKREKRTDSLWGETKMAPEEHREDSKVPQCGEGPPPSPAVL